MSPLKPPAQAAAASAGGCSAERRTHSGSEQPAARASSSRAAAASATASSKVQKPRRNTSNQKAGIVSRQPARGRAPGITSRARATLGITAARAPPHAGRWESLDTHAGTRAGVSRITVTCRVRNNRIICQSSDPLEGMAITLNQWILLTACAIQSDAVAPNARRGTRLPSPQVVCSGVRDTKSRRAPVTMNDERMSDSR